MARGGVEQCGESRARGEMWFGRMLTRQPPDCERNVRRGGSESLGGRLLHTSVKEFEFLGGVGIDHGCGRSSTVGRWVAI